MLPNRLREIRKQHQPKLTLERLAELVHQHSGKNVSHQQLSRLEKGERKMTFDWAKIIAPALGVEPDDLMIVQRRTVPIVGYVRGYNDVVMIDIQAGQQEKVPCPRGIDPQSGAVLIVRGYGLGNYISEGWLLFYDRRKELTLDDAIEKLCVVKVADEAKILIRKVRQGNREGLFNLIGDSAALREDVKLEWATPVRAYLSPDMAYGDGTAAPEAE